MRNIKEKKAISLIVLVITIIVMIILAGTVILSLSNSGIFDKAQEAVDETNLKQLQQMAQVAWGQEYARLALNNEEVDPDELNTAVRNYLLNSGYTANQLNNYEIVVTIKGVTVTRKSTNNDNSSNLQVVTNPYGEDDWDYAWGYTNSTSSWSSIKASGEEVTGNIIAKLYIKDEENCAIVFEGSGPLNDMGNICGGGDVIIDEEYDVFLPQRVSEIIIVSGITSIGNTSMNNYSLASISLPSTLTSIGNGAFQNTGLTSITIPEGVTSIGNGAFSGCGVLASITLPSTLTSIEGYGTFVNIAEDSVIYVPNQTIADLIEGKYETDFTTVQIVSE